MFNAKLKHSIHDSCTRVAQRPSVRAFLPTFEALGKSRSQESEALRNPEMV